jgi:hypothetical protein
MFDPGDSSPLSARTISDITCVRRRSGKVWGHIIAIIIDCETRLPVTANVLVAGTQRIQRVPWTYLARTDHGYRLKVGTGELTLLPADNMHGTSQYLYKLESQPDDDHP